LPGVSPTGRPRQRKARGRRALHHRALPVGELASAARSSLRISLATAASSCSGCHGVGAPAVVQWPGHGSPVPLNRVGSTAGPAASTSSPCGRAGDGMDRDSRTPRVRAWFSRMRNTHVRSDERPSKRPSRWITASQVSARPLRPRLGSRRRGGQRAATWRTRPARSRQRPRGRRPAGAGAGPPRQGSRQPRGLPRQTPCCMLHAAFSSYEDTESRWPHGTSWRAGTAGIRD
jgi:hypothetical protein